MNQETPKGFMGIPQYIIISFLTIFAIGPQYFINLSYSMNQEIVQNSLHFDSEGLMIPSILANIAFALGIPFGPVLTRVLGFKRNYLIMVCIFLLGSIIGVISPDLLLLIIGRVIQGIVQVFCF